jgi:predicted ATPase
LVNLASETRVRWLTQEIAESQSELLARHCSEASLIEKAAQFWAKAAERSLERSAFGEALAQATRALTLLAGRPWGVGVSSVK